MDEKQAPSLAEASPDGIFILADAGTILFASPGVEKTTGLATQETIGTSFWNLLHKNDHAVAKQLFRSNRGGDNVMSGQLLGVGGVWHQMNMQVIPFALPQLADLILVICHPVFEPSAVSDSMAEMIGGAAHDFNNILTAIMVNLSIARMEVAPNDPQYSALAEARQACLEGRDLTKRLSSFVSKGFPLSRSESTAEVVKDTVDFTLHGSEVKSEVETNADLWDICIGRLELSQIIYGVVRTAKDAMPAGGRLSVRVRNFPVRARSTLSLPRGDYVKLRFEDNGIGLPPEEVELLQQLDTSGNHESDDFDLRAISPLIRRRGGEMQLKSKLGAGTVVTLYLPATGQVETTGVSDDSDKIGSQKGAGRVLILDDEALIRSSLKKMLRSLGYDITVAEDGDTAITLFTKAMKSNVRFDVVLLDLTVPGGKGGREVLKILKEVDPQVKAIITSGYLDDPVFRQYRRLGFAGALRKPFRMREVSGKIQEVLKFEEKG